MMDREEDEGAALSLSLRHLSNCEVALAGVPQCLVSVSYTRRKLADQLGPAAGGGRKRFAKGQDVALAVGEGRLCQFCCRKFDARGDSVRVRSRGREGERRPYTLHIRCGFCNRNYVEEKFTILVQVDTAEIWLLNANYF
jgi:hypothetical protein